MYRKCFTHKMVHCKKCFTKPKATPKKKSQPKCKCNPFQACVKCSAMARARAKKRRLNAAKKKAVRAPKKPKFVMAKSRPRPTGLVIALQGAKQQLRKELGAQILAYFQSGGSLKVFAPQEKPQPDKYKKPKYYTKDEYYGKR